MARRYVVLGFRNHDGSLGFALSANPLGYLIKNRTGEYATRFVAARAQLLWAIPQASYDYTVALRNQLNELDDHAAAALVRDQSVSAGQIEKLRAMVDEAWPAYEAEALLNVDLVERAWGLLPPPAVPTLPLFPPVGLDLDNPFEPLPEIAWPTPPRLERAVADRDPGLCIFDLDGTLVDSSLLLEARELARQQRDWAPVRAAFDDVRPFAPWRGVAPHLLPGLLRELGCRVAIVSRSPGWYVEEIMERFEIEADDVEPASGYLKAKAFERVIARAGTRPVETWVFGDNQSDFRAADYVRCRHLGNPWLSKTMSPRAAPDIAWFDSERLLSESDWTNLSYLGEHEDPSRAPWHRGSLLPLGDDALALGRYFKARSDRHAEPLSTAILEGKDTIRPQPVIASGLEIALEHVRERGEVELVVTIPPHAGAQDRFAEYRRRACAALGASDEVDVEVTNPVPAGYKTLTRDEKRALRAGRYTCHDDLSGRTLLVIDDVTTTGSTVGAMSDALYEAGASRVIQLVWGVTQD